MTARQTLHGAGAFASARLTEDLTDYSGALLPLRRNFASASPTTIIGSIAKNFTLAVVMSIGLTSIKAPPVHAGSGSSMSQNENKKLAVIFDGQSSHGKKAKQDHKKDPHPKETNRIAVARDEKEKTQKKTAGRSENEQQPDTIIVPPRVIELSRAGVPLNPVHARQLRDSVLEADLVRAAIGADSLPSPVRS